MTSQVPPFLKQISTMSDTILLFKEDKNPVAVIKDVSNSTTFFKFQYNYFRLSVE
jgi:hypothetical protein